MDTSQWSKLWDIYKSRLFDRTETERQSFLSILSPSDHMATFQWICPVQESSLYKFFLGSFQEQAGDYAGALMTFRSLQESKGFNKYASIRFQERAAAAISRLSKLNATQKTGLKR